MVLTDHYESELNELLLLISEKVDIAQCREKDIRYCKSFAYETVDSPPLVVVFNDKSSIQFPAPWNKFKYYDYKEAFENPVAMMQNMLIERVLPGLLSGDDSPFAIRNNHGTIQIASLLGGNWEMHENNFPWISPFKSIDSIKDVTDGCFELDLSGGLLPKSVETLKYYRSKLDDYPVLKQAIQISMPDLQGPFDTAEQLWGSEIFYSFYDEPDLLEKLLSRIVEVMLIAAKKFRQYTVDRLDMDANTQHEYVIPGRLLIRNDSSIMLSPDIYNKFIKPYDALLLNKIGKGSIHFCGNGQHLIKDMLEIPDLLGLDFGDSSFMDIHQIYMMCRDKKVALTSINPSREDLISGKACKDMPTGVVFVYNTDSIDDAKEVVRGYKSFGK
ncbi:MAG: hypothetical protein FIA99_19480 [Ruminiclostridium sp.]|nr:hypothetical protein [Ruminiclostridium sp.]